METVSEASIGLAKNWGVLVPKYSSKDMRKREVSPRTLLASLIRRASPRTYTPWVSFSFVRMKRQPNTNHERLGVVFRRLTRYTLPFDTRCRQCCKPQRCRVRKTMNGRRFFSARVREKEGRRTHLRHRRMGLIETEMFKWFSAPLLAANAKHAFTCNSCFTKH